MFRVRFRSIVGLSIQFHSSFLKCVIAMGNCPTHEGSRPKEIIILKGRCPWG